jgi:predicted Zn-dependent protease
LTLFYAGDAARAEQMLAPLRGGAPIDRRGQAALASIYAARGAGDDARALAKTAAAFQDHHVAYHLGATYTQLGEFGEAKRWLVEAARTGYPCYPMFARDPLLDPLRSDPEFQQFLGDMKKSWQALAEKYGSNVARDFR